MVSLDKLVTLNLRYRSIGRPTKRPTSQAQRKAEERYLRTHRDIARALARTECAFVHRIYNPDDFETSSDFDSTWLSLCKARAIAKSGIPARWNLPFRFGELAKT